MAELKPCPFCGCKDISIGWWYDPIFGCKVHTVRCKKCGAEKEGDTEQQAIDAWNKRS